MRRLQTVQFPRAFCRDFTVPRKQSRKRKKKFECSGGKHSSLRGKSISGNERAIPHVQKGKMARRVTRRKYGLKRNYAIAIIQESRQTGFLPGHTPGPFA